MNTVEAQSVSPVISYFRSFTESRPGILNSEQSATCIGLHKCVNQVITDFLPCAAAHSNKIINDVSPKMLVSTDKQTLTTVIARLLDTVLHNSQNNNIHVSAKLIGNITLIHIRSSNATYSDSIVSSMENTELQAEKIGGCLTISNSKLHDLTLSFTFINH